MYNLTHLLTFVSVADLGSFTKYADKAFLSTNAVMKQVDNLEKSLGDIKLFERSNKGIIITPAGKVLYDEAVKILKMCDESHKKIIEEFGLNTFKIRIAVPFTLGAFEESRILREVSLRNPRIQFKKVSEGASSDELFVNYRNFDAWTDVALDRYDEHGLHYFGNQYNALEIRRIPMCCILSINHPLANKEKIRVSDLSGQTVHTIYNDDDLTLKKINQLLRNEANDIKIVEHKFYTRQLYDDCSNSSEIFIGTEVVPMTNPLLTAIPFEDVEASYGFIYKENPSEKVEQFIKSVQEILNEQ